MLHCLVAIEVILIVTCFIVVVPIEVILIVTCFIVVVPIEVILIVTCFIVVMSIRYFSYSKICTYYLVYIIYYSSVNQILV